jgi:hypothetical protein
MQEHVETESCAEAESLAHVVRLVRGVRDQSASTTFGRAHLGRRSLRPRLEYLSKGINQKMLRILSGTKITPLSSIS